MQKKYDPNIELINLVIAGSVDDGKSTLLGRLFYDLEEIYDDQLESLAKSSNRYGNKEIDLSFFTDGLSAEREQKITIDVAYRYFSTNKRRFVIADVPGHEQYTRNMVTGAANANVAIIICDARKGLLIQSKRHLFIASLLGIPHIVIVVNKMDAVDYDEDKFNQIKQDFIGFSDKLNIHDLQFIPVSSLKGDMVVERGDNLSWYRGQTVIDYLENVQVSSDRNLIDFRFPVQLVLRPNQDFRGYAGTIESGTIKKGEKVKILPSQVETKIESVLVDGKNQDYAFASQPAVITLTDDVDVSRGEMIVRENNLSEIDRSFEAKICWMSSQPLVEGGEYILKQTTKSTRVSIDKVFYCLNINNLHREKSKKIKLNEIGKIQIKAADVLMFDSYSQNRNTGSFIIIDEETNNTVGAGVIIRAATQSFATVDYHRRSAGAVLWFTGLSGSGKTTIADALFNRLNDEKLDCERLDGDVMRESLSKDLGFSAEDRDKNIDRASFLAGLLSKHQVIVLASFISPYRRHRQLARERADNFIEIFVDSPLKVCEQRDVKGLYKKARSGEIANFTGIDDEYQVPDNPDLSLKTSLLTVDECVDKIFNLLKDKKII